VADYNIQITISAIDKATKDIKDAAKATGDLNKQTDKLEKTAGKTKTGIGGLSTAIKAAGAAISIMAVQKVAGATFELMKLGAQSIRTKTAFENISGGAGQATERLEAMQRATRGAMSEQQMMGTANRLMQMGLADSAEELERVVTMATRLGSAMGVGATEAVESFALTLANTSIPRLDLFGISAGKVRKRIQELQAAMPGMAREAAFFAATMEVGGEAMARLGDVVEDEALSIERLEASWTDLKTTFGEAFATLTPLLDAISGGLGIIRDLSEKSADTRKEQAGWVTTLRTLLPPLNAVLTVIEWLAPANDDLIASMGQMPDAADEYRRFTGAAAEATEDLVVAERDLKAELSDLASWMRGPVSSAMDDYREQQADIQQEIDKTNESLADAIVQYGATSDEAQGYRDDLTELEQKMVDLAETSRQKMHQLIYDMAMARMAADGEITAAEADFALALAEHLGLIDENTRRMAENINTALDGLAAGEGISNTLRALDSIAIAGEIAAGRVSAATMHWEDLRRIYGQYGGSLPGRQSGGPVSAGQPYWVGEAGRELFVPQQSGNIVSHEQSTNYHFSQTVHTRASTHSVMQDFEQTRALMGA